MSVSFLIDRIGIIRIGSAEFTVFFALVYRHLGMGAGEGKDKGEAQKNFFN